MYGISCCKCFYRREDTVQSTVQTLHVTMKRWKSSDYIVHDTMHVIVLVRNPAETLQIIMLTTIPAETLCTPLSASLCSSGILPRHCARHCAHQDSYRDTMHVIVCVTMLVRNLAETLYLSLCPSGIMQTLRVSLYSSGILQGHCPSGILQKHYTSLSVSLCSIGILQRHCACHCPCQESYKDTMRVIVLVMNPAQTRCLSLCPSLLL